MTTFFQRVLVLVLLAILTSGAAVRGAAPPVDPVVGEWLYHFDHPVTLNADGTARYRQGDRHGTWEYLHNSEVQRHYRLVWDQGKYVDLLILSEDGQRAHVVAQIAPHDQYEVRRAASDKPVAAGPTPVPHMATPTPVLPKPASPAATAQPTVAVAADPIIGDWHWLKGQSVTFLPDGTVKSDNGGHGTWEFLRNPEAERKYRLAWSPDRYVCDVTYDPATGIARATNTKGRKFDVKKAAATDKADGYFGAPGR